MFRRDHHNRILSILNALDGELLAEAECFFGGGTAIVLELGEYRESVDIDFLCASQEGYRKLRTVAFGGRFDGFTTKAVTALREVRADQYGIRTMLEVEGLAIRFEIIREARVTLAGAVHPLLGVPVLGREDLFCEKLLANADRWHDNATLSRDIIDLSMMILAWGGIPAAAWDKARVAYGETVDRAYAGAVGMIRDRVWLAEAMGRMGMDAGLAGKVLAVHG
jgi:hypothetical protein